MKKIFKKHWALVLILLLSAILRLYGLGRTPPSLMWDETALGYNAYSILKTARDEYGTLLPLIFKSFGDYKPGLYVYLMVPSVALFGLNEFAVRLPSALLGILTVFLLYSLVNELFKNKFEIWHLKFGIWPALVLALSPWHIEFSRGAWEANLAIFLTAAGVLIFLKALRENRFLPLAALLFGLTFLAYQGAKVFTPLLVFGLFVFYRKGIQQISKRIWFVSILVLVVLVFPVYSGIIRGEGGRAKVMSIFSYPRPQEEIQEILSQDQSNQNSLVFKLFHNEPLNFTRGILGRYFNHFAGRFLFFEGDWSNKRLGVPYMGVMYFIEVIFLLLGLYVLVQEKETQARNFLFYWLLVSPIPAVLTRDSVSAVRALNMVIPLTILVGAGLYQLILWLKNQKRSIIIIAYCLLLIAYGWSFVYFLDQYFIHAPIHNSSTSQYGYRQVVNFMAPIAPNYPRIAFTQKYGQPYIYWLFYTQYDPQKYQQQSHLIESSVGDVGQVQHLDNIEFRNFHWLSDVNIADLFIGDELDLPKNYIDQTSGARLLKEVYFLNGQLAFRIVEKK